MAGLDKSSKLMKTRSTTVSSSIEKKSDERPPKGAKINRQSIRTETEEIENGFLVSKNYDGSWVDSKGENHYFYFSKKWFSKDDPLTVTVNDKDLASEFEEDEE